ncbi:MAG TPA: PIN domain-containing protein [Sphingomicrobium sp.]
MLGTAAISGPFLLDTNVFIAALAGRGPPELALLLANLPQSYVSGAVLSELAWTRGRLDPRHCDTVKILRKYNGALSNIDQGRMLVPDANEWMRAGELAGTAARATAGGVKSIKTAFDRMELLNDATTAVVAVRAGATVVTSDRHFDIFMQIETDLNAVFYD